jgi:DNA invertase Pin-like site-specific DNA recombinase
MRQRVTFGVNEKGIPLGEAHPTAKLTDREVEEIRDLAEHGIATYARLAEVYGVSKHTIGRICRFERRACTPVAYRTKMVEEIEVSIDGVLGSMG